ncbi:uncharacterized protein FA14DRAFT_179426 [Meira miltonrushii]|uniref:Uncharacterized protein n=1 Tax=Meira miltonrushii TaxID=1280837 RepID=A0A316VJ60_9BASI|nr:uncharacterized protein FA14DRAFT_179426 [Meira miltonrushii]PWN36061.1 hypothetical protein FA14DRAFT_179426 [Meira miltonrushii]
MSRSQARPELPAIPCVRGRNNAAQLLRKNAYQELYRQDSLLSSSSYASNSSWQSQSHNEPHIMLPSALPYLANGGGRLQGFESSRNSWQSYMDSTEWEEDYNKGAFFTTLAQQHILPSSPTKISRHQREDEIYESDHSSALECGSEVSSALSGYTDCNKDDVAIWKKLEKALDTRFSSKNQNTNPRSEQIPSSLQPGSPLPMQYPKPKNAPGRFSEPPKVPIPPKIAQRPSTLIYQYQRVTAAGSAAKHRRIYSGGQHKEQFM